MQSKILPLVSVIIPTFNRANYVIEAVHSALNQTYSNIEVILVDDGSTDNTRKLIQQLDDNRLMYYYQSNQGRSAARNFGAQIARGDLLGFLDLDDLYLPDTIQNHIQIFSENPDLGMTIGGYEYIDEEGNVFASRDPWVTGARINLDNWLFDCFAIPGSILLRKDWFEKAGGFDTSFNMAEDWLLFMQLALLDCPMDWVRRVVCRYRQHPMASVHALKKHREGSLRALDKLFSKPNLPPEIKPLKNKAKAWVHVIFAKKSLAISQDAEAEHELKEAVILDPELAGKRKLELLEFLLTPNRGWFQDKKTLDPSIIYSFPASLQYSPAEIKRSQSRIEMSNFFHANKGPNTKAWKHLIAGLKMDPRWITNKGVLSFSIRYILKAPYISYSQKKTEL